MPKTYFSDSHEGMSSLPTNSHAAMLMSHRCAVVFTVAEALVAGDLIYLGKLPNGYTIESLRIDSDGVVGLTADILQINDTTSAEIELSKAVSFVDAGIASAPLSLAAVRLKGDYHASDIVAKIVGGGSVTKGKQLGVTITYKYRQVTY